MVDENERVKRFVEAGEGTRFGAKRGPGRPPKQPVGEPVVDPGAAAATPGAEPREPDPKPAGGRPSGNLGGNGAKPGAGKKESPSLDLSGLAGVIAGAHALAAMRTGHPHWQLSESDSKRYAIAVANVLRHYSVKASQKAIDHAALLFAVFEMETPRLALSQQIWRGDAAKERAQHGEQPGATIYRMDAATP